MIAVYLVPTQERDLSQENPNKTGKFREPILLEEAKSLPGWKTTAALGISPEGTLIPYTILGITADSFGAIDSDPRVIKLGEFSTMKDWLDADTSKRSIPLSIKNVMSSLGLATTGTLTRRELFYRIAHKLEIATEDDVFEKVMPDVKSSITDDFAGTGAMTASWEMVYDDTPAAGNVERSSGRVITTAVPYPYAAQHWRRIEAAFPDNQYAQIDSKALQNGTIVPAVRMDNTGTGYTLVIASGDLSIWTFNGVTLGYVINGSTSFTSGVDATVKIDATGTTITAYNGGSSICNNTSSTYTTGKPGIFCKKTDPGSDPSSDNFECTDATGGGVVAHNLSLLGVGI